MGDEKLKKDYAFFKSKLDELMKNDKGKFAVIKDEKILDIFDTEESAKEYIENKKLKLGTFLLQEITDRVEYISRMIG